MKDINREYYDRFGEIPPLNPFVGLRPLIEKALGEGKRITKGDLEDYLKGKQPWDLEEPKGLERGLAEGFKEED